MAGRRRKNNTSNIVKLIFSLVILAIVIAGMVVEESEEPVSEEITDEYEYDVVLDDLLEEYVEKEEVAEQPESWIEDETEEEVTSDAAVDGEMAVHFLDVEQGLAVFVQCDGMNMIYDGGDRGTSSAVVSYLKNMGVETIDYLISSHYDSDHVAGLIGCLNAFKVENVISSDYVHDSKTYETFVDTVAAKGLTMQHPAVGTEYAFGSGKLIIMAPDRIDPDDSNANSVVVKVVHGGNAFMLMGDAEIEGEERMCAAGLDVSCNVLVLGHHGSATATGWELLMNAVPEYAVISCGIDNSYGHPHEEVMERLEGSEIEVYRTDKQGWISVVSDGTSLDWSQEPCNDYTPGVN